MGWDISYHPLGANEIASIYFAGVENPDLAAEFSERFNIPQFHHENLKKAFTMSRDEGMVGPFAAYQGMNLAVVAGHLRKYWYVRGGAMSFLADDEDFIGYFSDFRDLVPEKYKELEFDNQLTQNYCCGVFMSNAALKRLLKDMKAKPAVREKMEILFSHGRLEVFMAAVHYAVENRLGLLEASEVIEPNPLDLNSTICRSNLHNCDPAGAILYHQATMEQIAAIEYAEKEAETENTKPEACATEIATPEKTPKKRGFFSRLFGK